MNKEIYISDTITQRRIAILEDGNLVELYVENPQQQGIVGNIYKGKVENVIPGMQAAFIDIGYEINAFLPFSEIGNPEYLKETSTSDDDEEVTTSRGSSRETQTLKEIQVDLQTGQDILVQVIKEPFASKGPRVTTNLTLPGHLLVIVPDSHFIGISKKIWDKYEKRRLRKITQKLVPEDVGVIIRTESEGKSEKLIKRDFTGLLMQWNTIRKKVGNHTAPFLIYEAMEAVSPVLRDLFTSDISKVALDSRKLYRKVYSYFEDISPGLVERLELYKGNEPLFEKIGIESEIEKATKTRGWLKSGAYIVIEHTEAMVIVDVNSGRFIGKEGHEVNSLNINLEAAREIARQLRLRDIGGLIVIDFIDMQMEENKQKVFLELKKELRKDRARVAVSPISEFGLLEMTRQRIRLSLLDSLTEACPTCEKSGRIASKNSAITRMENWLKKFRQKSRELRLKLIVNPSLGNYLRSEKKEIIRHLMWSHFVHIEVSDDIALPPDKFRVMSKKRNEDITEEV